MTVESCLKDLNLESKFAEILIADCIKMKWHPVCFITLHKKCRTGTYTGCTGKLCWNCWKIKTFFLGHLVVPSHWKWKFKDKMITNCYKRTFHASRTLCKQRVFYSRIPTKLKSKLGLMRHSRCHDIWGLNFLVAWTICWVKFHKQYHNFQGTPCTKYWYEIHTWDFDVFF